MYRTPAPSIRCPMCGMANVLPPTRLRVSGGEQVELQLALFERPEDRFALELRSFPVTHGRLCLDCGHVAWAVPESALAKARADLPRLRPHS